MSRTLKISITSEGDTPMTQEEKDELVTLVEEINNLFQNKRLTMELVTDEQIN